MDEVKAVGNLHWADILVIVAYFIIVLAVGLWASFRSSRGSVSGYFLAGRNMHWILVGASLFASNIGSGHFVGLAGSGAAGGIAVAGFELNAIFILMVLGWFFVPVYITSGVYTMPEYLRKRFGGQRIRVYLSCLAILLYVFTKISADLYAGAIFINQSLEWNLYPSIGVLLLIACVFTVMGGLTAVIWTDTIQVVIMLIGAFILMFMSFYKVGGYNSMVEQYFLAIPPDAYTINSTACAGFPRQDAMNLFRAADADDLPWPGMTFGLTISAVWYWCSDQVIVQRALAAKNYSHAKGGCVFGALLKFLPLWLLVFPGMISRVLFPEIACTDPDACEAYCKQRNGCTNVAYPKLVLEILPAGLRGLMLSCMLSALMSSLTSIFNSSSTIFTMDIWKLIRKNCSDIELLIVGRLFVVVLVVIGILWIPIIQNFPGSQLFDYIQSVTSCLAPPICAVYCLAIFWPRTNEPGAFWGLMMGLLVGLVRFILDVASSGLIPGCDGVDGRTVLLTKVHYLHFGIILFAITLVVTVCVSLITPPIDEKHLARLTFWSRFSKVDRVEWLDDQKAAAKRVIKLQQENELKVKRAENGEAETIQPQLSLCRRIFNFVFGLDAVPKELSEEERELMDKNMISLEEDKKVAMFWNISAVVVMALAVFFYAFYA